jgi:tetratricopeptide (TPR) repeat protein
VDAPVSAIHRNLTPPGAGQLTADVALRKAIKYGPDLPETTKARGWYLWNVERDRDSALHHFEDALRARPSDPDLHGAIGLIRISQGHWAHGLQYLERALSLDSDGYWRAVLLGQAYANLRRYDDAERLYNLALAVAPTYAEAHIGKAMVRLSRDGDVRGATRVLEEASRQVDRADLVSRFVQPAGRYPFIRILAGFFSAGLADSAVVRDVSSRCVACYWHVQAQMAERGGDPDVARVYYDSAFAYLFPDPEQPPLSFRYAALWAAGLGRDEEAIRYADSTVARGPTLSSDAISGYHRLVVMAEVYARTGAFDDAVAALEQLLSHPGLLSVPILELDPLWDPLRSRLDFQRLLEVYRVDTQS